MKSFDIAQINQMLDAAPGGRVHLVGIGGCGMSGLAHLFLDLGYLVRGTDVASNTEIVQLKTRGAEIQIGHNASWMMEKTPDMVIYSSAIRRDNPELQEAEELRIPLLRRASALAALMQRQRGVCVAGMHGKTTTSSLLAFALKALGKKSSYAVGASVPQLQPHAFFENRVGDPETLFVVEADESDGTLREFFPQFSILLNLDEEHLDYYANLEAVCREFKQFAEQTAKTVFFCADDDRLPEVLSDRAEAISFGFHPLARYRAVISAQPGQLGHGAADTKFEVWCKGQLLGLFQISLFGEKNISNATAVIAFLHHVMQCSPEQIQDSIRDFHGASRRQQELFSDDRFRIFDDYGHHPCEIEATLKALKGQARRRLLVAFQPHRFTRTHFLLQQFAVCFKQADLLWVTEVYAASESEIPGANGQALAQAIRAQGQAVDFRPDLQELKRAVRSAMRPGDLVLLLGAGSITQAAHELANELKEEMPASMENIIAELSQIVSADTVLKAHEPLAKKTTMRVGGTADVYVEPANESDLARVLKFSRESSIPFFILGRGSNLLIRDGGIRGIVISLSNPHFSRVEVAGDLIICGAGAKLKAVSVEARRNNLMGLEFLEGIPGSVGGSLRMNAGAMGSWMFEVVESIRFMDYEGNIHERKTGEVHFEYRGCPLFKSNVALGAVLRGRMAPRESIEERAQGYNQKRWLSQPAAPSAGCIFKNPASIPAGKLIDELGLKGARVGGAVVSDVHGNFIVNDGQATAGDVLALIDLVKQKAWIVRGIELHTEVEIIGEYQKSIEE